MFDKEYLNKTLSKAFELEDAFYVPKGITRHNANRGWWVRVTRNSAKFHKFFTDNVFDGVEESLKKAILYRHEILSNFEIEPNYGKRKTIPKEPEDRIRRVDEEGRKQRYIAWQARWYDQNHEIQFEYFSVNQYGEGKAKKLALKAAEENHNKKPKPPVKTKPYDPYEKQEFKKETLADINFWGEYYQKTRSYNGGSQKISNIVSENPFAFEGGKKIVIHQQIERNPKIRLKKISAFLEENDKLFCELCEFSFKETFPFLKKDIIEVHHIVPLSKLTKKTKIRLADLMLLCSNCHFAIHQGNAEKNLEIAKSYFDINSSSFKKNANKAH